MEQKEYYEYQPFQEDYGDHNYLTQLHPGSEMPLEAYLFQPDCTLELNSVGEDRMFICGKHIQRLIFKGGQPLEENEQKQVQLFKDYLAKNKLELPLL